ncbi:MAG TPA: hypothetical protein EYQ82_12080 [Dehalococcoidia bacterium]|nr:hypothetical protein [Dehalococcoidia bacterium]HIK98248.1 hypothetical protein [Dehalococcoidia bacterium]
MHITTQRRVLREFTMDDWPDVLAYQPDLRYLRFDLWTGCMVEEVRDFERRADYEITSTSRAAGGIHCCTGCFEKNGADPISKIDLARNGQSDRR